MSVARALAPDTRIYKRKKCVGGGEIDDVILT